MSEAEVPPLSSDVRERRQDCHVSHRHGRPRRPQVPLSASSLRHFRHPGRRTVQRFGDVSRRSLRELVGRGERILVNGDSGAPVVSLAVDHADVTRSWPSGCHDDQR